MMASNPFPFLLPVPPDSFFGRWPLVKYICADLTREFGDSYAIVAGRRCGKSSMLRAISYQLDSPETRKLAKWSTITINMDFKEAKFKSPENIYSKILGKILLRIKKDDKNMYPIKLNDLKADWLDRIQKEAEIAFHDFVKALSYILEDNRSPKPIRFVFLFDETDVLLSFEWVDDLFNQLRTLIYSEEISNHVRYVFAGSRKFLEEKVNDSSSPLWNVLNIEYLEVFNDDGFSQLCKQFSKLPEEIVERIRIISGAHPFLAQYLLHYLWEEHNIHTLNPSNVDDIAQQFIHKRLSDLREWSISIGIEGWLAYQELLPGDWVLEENILKKNRNYDLKSGLVSLCYHGLAMHDNGWKRYKLTGDLFKIWFVSYEPSFLWPEKEAKLNVGPFSPNIAAQTAIFNTQIQNDQLNAGNISNSPGIAFGSHANANVDMRNSDEYNETNSTPKTPSEDMENNMTEKDESNGSGNITVGDLSNNKGVAIGHRAQAIVNESGASSEEVAKAFAAISEQIKPMPEGPKKTMAQAAVQGLKEEADKGDKADESKVSEWMNFLAQTASDAFDVAVATFANPIAGLGLAFKKIAQKAKEEKAQKDAEVKK